MKKNKKVQLSRETLLNLLSTNLGNVEGAFSDSICQICTLPQMGCHPT